MAWIFIETVIIRNIRVCWFYGRVFESKIKSFTERFVSSIILPLFLAQLPLSLPLPENKIITSDYFQQYWFGSHIVTCVVNLVYFCVVKLKLSFFLLY